MGENPTGPRRAWGRQGGSRTWAAPPGEARILTPLRDHLRENGHRLRSVVSGASPTSLALHLAVGFAISATGRELAGGGFDCGTGYLLVAEPPHSPTPMRSPAT